MDNKIKIAYLIDTISSDKAGTEKQLINIIERLDRNAFKVTLICLYVSPWMHQHRLPCEVITIGYKGFLKPSFPFVMRRYIHILSERRFDVVQTFFEDSMIVGCLGKILCRKRHALVVSRRDLGLGSDEPIYHWFYKKMRPLILKYTDGIAVNAHAIKDHISKCEGIPPEKIIVIRNGIDISNSPVNPPALFSQFIADIWIGIAANLKPVKRIDVFLRALAHLKEKVEGVEIRAIVLGDGRLRSAMAQLATDLGLSEQVHFVGAVDNIYDYLQCIDIGVLCSEMEGLSNAILEYMACGLPVVATAVGGNPELINETNGICVPAGNHVALGDALLRLISSATLRKSLGEKSLDKVRNSFTWDMIMPQWEKYYCSIAGQKV